MRWRAQVHELFARLDVLVLPVLPGPVPRRGEAVTGLSRLTNPWNLAAVPAGAVPVGLLADGAPAALPVVGPHRVLAAMAAIEHVRTGAVPPGSPPAR